MKICKIEGCNHKLLARGLCATHYSRWRIHGDPSICLTAASGTGHTDARGYVYISVNKQQKLEHVVIAEKALGRVLKKPELVHHADCNKSNNSPSNLVICPDDLYHQLLHKRIRAQRMYGYVPGWVR